MKQQQHRLVCVSCREVAPGLERREGQEAGRGPDAGIQVLDCQPCGPQTGIWLLLSKGCESWGGVKQRNDRSPPAIIQQTVSDPAPWGLGDARYV